MVEEEVLTRSARKRRSIMAAAQEIFLEHGYTGTSMDQIAARAEVSKQTIYKHFSDKPQLFSAFIVDTIERTGRLSKSTVDALADTDDLDTDLRDFARHHVRDVLQPHLIRLRRIIISEADRFPDLARTWYETGPERAIAIIADRFQSLTRRGLLAIEDHTLAAHHFNWLVLAIPLNQAMFRHPGKPFSPAELNHFADEGVRVFLAAYRA